MVGGGLSSGVGGYMVCGVTATAPAVRVGVENTAGRTYAEAPLKGAQTWNGSPTRCRY
jgi:hypothetical protein